MTPRQPTPAAILRGFRSPFRSASLLLKLTVLSAGVTAVVVLAALYALSVQTRRSARTLFAEELERHQTMLVALQRRNLDLLVSASAIVTQSASLRSALETYRMEENVTGSLRADLVATVERELAKLLDPIDRDLLIVTDLNGRVFASIAREGVAPAPGASLAGFAAVRRAIGRDPSPSPDAGDLGILRARAATYQLAVHPLTLNGFTIGSLILGERLDGGVVHTVRTTFDGELVVLSGDSVLHGAAAPALVEALARARGPAQSTSTIRAGREEFVAAALPLGETQEGTPVTLWLVQPLQRTVNALLAPLFRDFFWYGLFAIALVALVTAFTTQSVLRPFREFVSYLRAGAASDVHQPFVTSASSAEIHTLNESFQRLMTSIEAKRRELAQRTTELTAANAVLVDEIRERERVEHALGERDAQLRQSQKLEAVGTLAGGIAHDFNNLLTAVSGFTQLALMNTDPDSAVAADLRQVVEAANRAGHLTKQLLAFSRKQVLRPTVVDVGEVVQTVAPMLSRLIGDHIELQVDVAPDVPRVLADRGQLEQVIMNLAINARDAMPRGGQLMIRVAPRAAGAGPATVALSVTDTGSGIPDAVRSRIFEPFFTTKEAGKGTGLGLSTVYGIVAQSGGRISVESTVNVGTTFLVELPAADEQVVAVAGGEGSIELPRGTETVLLVEDDTAVRALARRTLEGCGYTVLPAADPLEALELAKTARIDVILSDLLMPHMTGVQMVERYLDRFPAPVVVFMSGYADDSLMAETRVVRSAFLRKPFSPAALARAIHDALDASRRAPAVAI